MERSHFNITGTSGDVWSQRCNLRYEDKAQVQHEEAQFSVTAVTLAIFYTMKILKNTNVSRVCVVVTLLQGNILHT